MISAIQFLKSQIGSVRNWAGEENIASILGEDKISFMCPVSKELIVVSEGEWLAIDHHKGGIYKISGDELSNNYTEASLVL